MNRPTMQQHRSEAEQQLQDSSDWLVVVDSALISTLLDCSCADSWGLFQKVGTSVANSVVVVAVLLPGG